MLLKFEAFEEVGRFARLKHKAPQFEKLTLIYARNGYGKSTICSVLRSASEQDPQIIHARRRLGAIAESHIHLKWKVGGSITFATGKWTACPDHVYVFDQEYVRRNLHVADSVTRDNRRSLLPVVLGDNGVALVRSILELDAEQRDLTSIQTAAERAIRAACPIVIDVKAFAFAAVPDEINSQITRAEKQLELARRALAVKQRSDPGALSIPSVGDIELLVGRSLVDVNERAEAMIAAHIEAQSMKPNGDKWLSYGVKHMIGDVCPFCTQDTTGINLVAAFKGYFSEAYTAFCSEIETTLITLETAYGSDGDEIRKVLQKHREDIDFWEAVCDLGDLPTLSSEEIDSIVHSYADLISLLKIKRSNPLLILTFPHREAVGIPLLKLVEYDTLLTACISKMSTARADATGSNATTADEILKKRHALKAKLEAPLSQDVEKWLTASARRSEIEDEKKIAQESLRRFVRNTVGPKQNSINALLELFGANFRITDTKASFVGREPNTEFSISIGHHSVKAGERMADKPCFTTILSAGDKSTLALAFFLTQMRSATNFAGATIIFDDPFSSQDMDRQWETTSQLRSLVDQCMQVIVLSHDPRFLELIDKNYKSRSLTLQMMCDDNGQGSISPWSIEDELKEVYVRQAERIREYASTGNLLKGITIDSLAKDLRPFVESFLRVRFPGRFGPLVVLDAMANEIENAGASDPAYKDVAAFRAINEYGRDNMHGGAQNPNPTALRARCKQIVVVIGSY